MPGSMPEGKDFILNFLLSYDIERILDVGPGSGNYFDLLSPYFTNVEWVAVEIWGPYLDSFKLKNKYNTIIVSDIFDIDWDELGRFDVIIFGDVIEHMEESRGREVIKQAVDHAAWVVVSLPIIAFPQEASYGNEYEIHVEQYSPKRIKDILKDYDLVAFQDGEVIGVYIFRKLMEDD